jgi:hypothetical protein
MPTIGTVVSPRGKSEYWQIVGTFPNKLYLENLDNPKLPIKIVMRNNFKKYWKIKDKLSYSRHIITTIKRKLYPEGEKYETVA